MYNQFRGMRRSKQLLTLEESEEILRTVNFGIMGVNGDDGYPYTVAVNHVYYDGKIYFHGNKRGHKADSIRANDKVSYLVVQRHDVVPEDLATMYVSVEIFGRARIVEDPDRIREVCREICRVHAPGFIDEGMASCEKDMASGILGIFEITPEHITGKCAKDIADAK